MRYHHPILFNLDSAPHFTQQERVQIALLLKKRKVPYFLVRFIYTFLTTPSFNENKPMEALLPFVSHYTVSSYGLSDWTDHNSSKPVNSKQPEELLQSHTTQSKIAFTELHNSLFCDLPHQDNAQYCFIDLKYNQTTQQFIAQTHHENVLTLIQKQSKGDINLLAGLCYFKLKGYEKKSLFLFNALSCYRTQSNLSELLEIASSKAPMMVFIRSNELSDSTLFQLKELLILTRLAGLVMIGKLTQPQLRGLQQILTQLKSNFVVSVPDAYTTLQGQYTAHRHESSRTESKNRQCAIQ